MNDTYKPTSPMTPAMTDAVREFAAKFRTVCATEATAAVLTRELQFLLEEGPESYLRYIRSVNDSVARGELEQHLSQVARVIGDDRG